jgi:hypothetical protein
MRTLPQTIFFEASSKELLTMKGGGEFRVEEQKTDNITDEIPRENADDAR